MNHPKSDYQVLAAKLVRHACAFGVKKADLRDADRAVIRSLGTARDYQACIANFLSFRSDGNVPDDGPYLRAEMGDFLRLSALTWRQKTMDQHRHALNKVFCVDLPRYLAEVPTNSAGKAYTEDEVRRIVPHQMPRNALGTELLFSTGMRAFEPLRLCDAHVMEPSAERPWRDDLFVGLHDFVVCRCPGKGGLCRSVAVPARLYEELDRRRYDAPADVRDRKIDYITYFDVGSGQALSQSFGDASRGALGFSLGIHGLRHAYIQRRLAQLNSLGIPPRDVLEICSQEVGHFRAEITLHYTRPRH